MNNFNDYYYIYRDSHSRWNEASNPKFIAQHKMCRAVEKAVIENIDDYLKKLNSRKGVKHV